MKFYTRNVNYELVKMSALTKVCRCIMKQNIHACTSTCHIFNANIADERCAIDKTGLVAFSQSKTVYIFVFVSACI